MALDPDDQFVASCNSSSSYPCNLLRTRHPAYALEIWSNTLNKAGVRLFDEDDAALELLEFHDGVRGMSMPPGMLVSEADGPALCTTVKDCSELQAHLLQNRKDPRFRYVYVEESPLPGR